MAIIHVDSLAQLLLLLPLLLLVVCLLLLLRLQPSKLVNLNFEFGPSLCCAVLSCALLHFYLRVLQALILLHEGILQRVCIMKGKEGFVPRWVYMFLINVGRGTRELFLCPFCLLQW